MTKPEALLFETARAYVLHDGGDGDAWILTPRYVELANEFYDRELAGEGHFVSRSEHDGRIYFSHQQESICFAPEAFEPPSWAGLVVKIGW